MRLLAWMAKAAAATFLIALAVVLIVQPPALGQGGGASTLSNLAGGGGVAAEEEVPFRFFREFLTYFTSPFLWAGAWLAIKITVLAMAAGLVMGLGLALMRLSGVFVLSATAWVYIWIMRGTPQLLQLVFIFDALPFLGIRLDSFTTAVIGFSLNQAAFSAEIIRGGILSVNRNQQVAADSLGLPPFLTLRRIILPQAMRAILPGTFNDTIGMLKLTSIASVIFVNELTFRSQQIVGQNFKFFEVFAAAGAIYLIMTSAISILQAFLERLFDHERETLPRGEGALRRMFGFDLPIPGLGGPRAGAVPAAAPVGASVPAAAAPAGRPAVTKPDLDWLKSLIDETEGQVAHGEPFVVARNVHKAYGGREVLRGIDLTVRRGEVVTILGPSGSGKSTFLRMINHLEAMDWGEITLAGRHVGYRRKGDLMKPERNLWAARAEARIGMVFQHFNLFNHMTALENVMEAPIKVYGMDRAAAEERALKLLALVGLSHHVDHRPHRLSGGQQQRVAIARALAVSPRLMLFDEPTSALDPELVGEVLGVMRRLADAGMTMIIVTHEIRFAREVADRVVFMDEGQVVEEGPPAQVIDAPEAERTRRFLRMVERAEEAEPA